MSMLVGRREQKKINNKKAIMDAALEVFATIGYERATVNDIVSESGLSVGTFYNHCGDKEIIFSELLTDYLAKVRSTLSAARQRADSLESFITGAFLAYSELTAEYPKMQQLISTNATVFKRVMNEKPELLPIIEDMSTDLQNAVDSGVLPDFPVSIMTSAMIAAGIDIFSMSDDTYSAKEKAEFLGNLFVGGIERLTKR